MIILEPQAGVAEKGEGEVRLPPDACEAPVRWGRSAARSPAQTLASGA